MRIQRRSRRRLALPDWRDLAHSRRCQTAVAGLAAMALGWVWLTPSQAELAVAGRPLFVHEWKPNDPLSNGGDGLGPVFNANSCVACHSLGGVGGAGGNQHNVAAFETLPTRDDSELHGGVVHAAAVVGVALETVDELQKLFPTIPGGVRVVGNCLVRIEDFDPVVMHQINTPALFGSGAINDISSWAIRQNNFVRRTSNIAAEVGGQFKRTPAGRVRVLPDGRIGKFGWKAQFATLEEFVATACALEVGLSNSYRAQDLPHVHAPDPDALPDMTNQQLRELSAFCGELPPPRQCVPDNPADAAEVQRGEELFTSIGCADCHTPEISGVAGVYSDFCLHSISPPESDGYTRTPEVPLPQDAPRSDEWKSPPLWGVADSAPYLHDGSAATLAAAIEAHHGAARHVRERYCNSSVDEQQALIRFLTSLRAPAADLASADK